ncbi:MAG: type III secretion inner membrane ring lipoprotein SctJ [Burkholderiaceae bacterium]|nr:type III secretion inner membrane ring lipoprotein SctJ [Burkholderiaceae bacterium]
MTSIARLSRRLAPLVIPIVLLAGCGKQELYSQLSERQANEVVAALQAAGIDAEKRSQEGQFSVLTANGDFPAAVDTLNAQGLPRETFDTMGSVFKREGFVSTPLEERARLLHAMSQEISNTLSDIDGVITARVHLVVPERSPLSDKPQPSAAAVFIKYRPGRNLAAQVPQIKALVVNSIEGLAYDNVTVALFPADPSPVGASLAAPAPGARAPRAGTLVGASIGLLVLGGSGLLWWHRRNGEGTR